MGAGQAVHHHVVVAGRGVGVCGGDSGGLADKGRLKRVNTNVQVTAFSVYFISNKPAARRENASPTDLQIDNSVVAPTCLERFSLSLVYDPPGPLGDRVHQKEITSLYCRIQVAVERVVDVVSAC